ncbi:hypothetical protein [Mumia sp. Pv 4-285]|uniref:hypothetical protein n=1 Tax=Mumia qirimensis TaxID=3234852 RepID=UPI00351D6C0B
MTTSTRDTVRASTTRNSRARAAAYAGLVLQLVVTALPLLDLAFFGTVENHVRAAYPDWPTSDVAADRNAIIWTLVGVGVLGTVGWLVAAWAAARGRAVRPVVTTLFVLGTGTYLSLATLGGEAYDTIVPLWLGMTSLVLTGLAGLTTTVAAWRRR